MGALPDYAELHCLSNFSFQRGASHAEELVHRAQALGYRALAITDECSLAGIVRAHVVAKELGLHLIVGAEFTLDDGLRLLLLAPNRQAYGDLCQLITRGRRNAPKGSYLLNRTDVAAFAEQLFALWLPPPQLLSSDCHWLQVHFPERLWLAVELLAAADDRQRLASLQQFAAAHALPCVATGDVHMHVRSRRVLQDVLTAIRLGRPVAQCGLQLFANGERHLRSRLRLARLYPPELLAATVAIAARCRFSLNELRYEYPQELVPAGETPFSWLHKLTLDGLNWRYPQGVPAAVQATAAKEMQLIAELQYEPFFLTVHDVVAFARRQGILCQGRGSAANSVVCYALGITEVDPSRMAVLFERFISRERNEPPDIDVDFEHERREEVMQYLYRKYGRERAALAAAVITYRRKSALRDVGRALGLAEDQLDRLSLSLAWWDQADSLPERLREAGLDPNSRIAVQLIGLVQTLRGFPRHLTQHVGGFVIARDRLDRLVPIENAAMAERTLIEWDKDDLDALGLLKVDVLALGMLSAIRRTLGLISQWRGSLLTLADIPAEDPATYAMIAEADTVGVFQIESRAQMSMLPRLRPKCFYDLVIEVAIVRPGPIQGGMVHPYLRRRQGLEDVDYPSEKVQEVLERTLGIPIFQEQVMQLAVVAAGYSPGEADQLRRSMAAWRRSGKLEPHRERLFQGMTTRGYTADFAKRIFKQIEGFSEYGFPESHAASFALLVYVSAWLKRHQPSAFAAGLINSQPMGFYSPAQIIQDLQRHGGSALAIDVQRSDWDCTLEANRDGRPTLRLGLRLVHGLGMDAGQRIAVRRPAAGYADVAQLASMAELDKRSMEALANADALASLSGHRRDAAWTVRGLDRALELSSQRVDADDSKPVLPAPRLGQDIAADYASHGLSLRAHPLSLLRSALTERRLLSADAIRNCQPGALARAAGLVTNRQRPGGATGVVFVTLEDETGCVNVIVWNTLVERQRRELLGARLLAVFGIIQREGAVVHLLAKRLVDLSEWLGELPVSSRDFH